MMLKTKYIGKEIHWKLLNVVLEKAEEYNLNWSYEKWEITA
jgi:hypothetical protein